MFQVRRMRAGAARDLTPAFAKVPGERMWRF
jgi:hypothetical protein